MPSDYEAITKHNERQLGLDTASRKTQICMYSDSTHFVYEILQNADDYGATEVFFRLSKNELVIEHDGKAFQEENVKAITYFGRSTSRDDFLKAGRFGVGFKSVFAFTATPIIISDNEHFRIHGLYRIEEHPYPDGFSRSRTRIVLPFNHEDKEPDYVEDLMPAKQAYKLITSRLTGLNMNTLLFTANIREIRWEIDGQSGHYLREDKRSKGARETTILDGSTLRRYLVFARTPSWRGQNHKDVELAFGIDEKGQITPIDDYLYVLFCTTQETHLQFIINGPYRTNPSRETISEEDSFNRHLVKETCELLRTVLSEIRDRGLLTTNCLAVMPNAMDSLRDFYSPLFHIVVDTFQKEELVPTDDGKFTKATDVMQGPAPIRAIISNSDLAFLAGKECARWAMGVTQNTRPDQFLKCLEIEQWGWQQLEEALESKYAYSNYFGQFGDDADAEWLQARPYQWMQKLYVLLADAIAKGDCNEWLIRQCCIVRVTENKKVSHIPGTKAYFPKGRGYRDLPQIDRAILRGRNKSYTKKIEDALVALGVKQIGDEERIDLIIETYYQDMDARVLPPQHLDHMKLFIKWWRQEKSTSKFIDNTIFRIVGSGQLHDADSCYLDKPLRSSGLNAIYKESRSGVSARHKLWSGYRELNNEGFCDFAIDCGVVAQLSIDEHTCDQHPNVFHLRQDWYGHGVKFTRTGLDQDYTIKNIAQLLKLKNSEINLLIWNTVRRADPDILKASYRPNQRYQIREDKSSLVLALSEAEWIPDKRGRMKKPSVISKSQLYPSFKYDNRNGWLDEIGFEENEKKASAEYQRKKEHAQALGVPIEIADMLGNRTKEEQYQIEALLKRQDRAKAKAQREQRESKPFHEALAGIFIQNDGFKGEEMFPVGRLARNPGRRRGKLQAEISSDIADEPSPDTRFTFGLCKKWKGKNDQVRTKLRQWYGGKCQICGQTFTQRNNEPYFEGLYLVPYTQAEWIDRVGNVLCLCPWHSAMFQFGGKKIDTDILTDVLAFLPRAEGGTADPVIALTLCDQPVTILFNENHFIELQTMIQESQKVGNSG